jgi:hypothetical protein
MTPPAISGRKYLIYNNIIFSSFSKESLPRLSGEYPDGNVGGRWLFLQKPLGVFL